MANPEDVGAAFIQYYYQLFESNRPSLVRGVCVCVCLQLADQWPSGSVWEAGRTPELAQTHPSQCKHTPPPPLPHTPTPHTHTQGNLYQDASMLTFEGQKFMGTQAIVGKLSSLAFGACKIHISSKDFQPSVSNGIMVFVTGNIQVCACVYVCAHARMRTETERDKQSTPSLITPTCLTAHGHPHSHSVCCPTTRS